MKKLLKEYGFSEETEYFEMCIESVINGQRTQAKQQFNAMPKESKKRLLSYTDRPEFKEYYWFFFNIL